MVVVAETHNEDASQEDIGKKSRRKVYSWPTDLVKEYTSPEVAKFFKSAKHPNGYQITWVHWGLGSHKDENGEEVAPRWRRADGSFIEPRREGRRNERRFTLEDIREIVYARARLRHQTEAETDHLLQHIDLVERGKAKLLDYIPLPLEEVVVEQQA